MAPTSDPVHIDTAHDDMIHDAQLDYYGKRLATCSSDRTIKIFDVVDGEPQRQAAPEVLQGHSGPVWQVAWAHPKYGNILASCSYDGRVFVWKHQLAGSQPPSYGVPGAGSSNWSRIKDHNLHTASVNSVSWAPHELGPILACASSDGKLSVLTFKNDGTADADIFNGHPIGCNAVSWAPATVPGSLTSPNAPGQATSIKRFASAGCDNLVRIWGYHDDKKAWVEETQLEGHTDWVRDVAWAPNIGLPRQYIATASQDKTVLIWTQDSLQAPWNKTALNPGPVAAAGSASAPGSASQKFPDVVWRVSWSLAGNILAVSCGDGKVSLWKENLKGVWECVSDLAS